MYRSYGVHPLFGCQISKMARLRGLPAGFAINIGAKDFESKKPVMARRYTNSNAKLHLRSKAKNVGSHSSRNRANFEIQRSSECGWHAFAICCPRRPETRLLTGNVHRCFHQTAVSFLYVWSVMRSFQKLLELSHAICVSSANSNMFPQSQHHAKTFGKCSLRCSTTASGPP